MFHTLVSLPEAFAVAVRDARANASEWAGALPASVVAGDVFLGSDPPGRNVGSGGGTIHLLYEAWRAEAESGKPGLSFEEWVSGGSRLILHAGGQSRRLPAYAATGKVFIPVPLREEMPTARFQQTLGDLQIPLYRAALREVGRRACVLIASGDVWLDFDPSTLPEVGHDLVGVGMRVSAEMATDFGVFFVRQADGVREISVEHFVQKPSVREIRKLERAGFEFWVDTGLWFLGPRAVARLATACGWDEARQEFAGPEGAVGAIDFYADWAPQAVAASAKDSTKDALSLGLVPLLGANFYHLGASRQILESFDALQQSRTRFRKSCYNSFAHSIYTGQSSREHPVWMDAVGQAPLPNLGGMNFVTLLPAGASVTDLPAEWCVDCVPLAGEYESRFAFRPYLIDDSGKGRVGDGATLFGCDAAVWMRARGIEDPGKEDIASVPLYPVLVAGEITQAWVEWFGATQPDAAISHRWRNGIRLSARDLLRRIDGAGVITAKAAGARASLLSMCGRMSAREEPSLMRFDFRHLAEVVKTDASVKSQYAEAAPEIWKQLESPLLKARWAMFCELLGLPSPVEGFSAREAAFDTLATAVIAHHASTPAVPRIGMKHDQIFWARSPVRLDLAGGWTDTPPYCFEEGGQVVNVAVDLNGQPPVQVFVRRTEECRLRIRSIDLGIAETITTFEELGGYRDARSGFSLAKAALCLTGLHPEFGETAATGGSLDRVLRRLGGGLELSLLCAVPKGSGLGTSSILAATLLGALSRALDLQWDKVDIYRRVLAVEQLLGTGGGWQDQAGGLFGGLKLVSTGAGFGQLPTVRYLPTDMLDNEIGSGELMLYYTGVTRLAKDILAQIVTHMFLREAATRETLLAIHRNASRMHDALQRGDPTAWIRCLARSWQLNGALDRGCNPPATQDIITRMGADFAAGKLLGAGGGGYLLIRARDRAGAENIRRKLDTDPPNDRARFVDLSISRSGLQVTTS